MSIKHAVLVAMLAGSLGWTVPAVAEQPPSNASAVSSVEPARTEREKRAAEILRQMIPDVGESMARKQPIPGFGGEMTRLSVENAYEQLWTRPGLSLKDRSMITIAMLVAIGAERELAIHVDAGLRNGLTPQELEEVIYQATAYVGFPRASGAMRVAGEVVARYQASRQP